jgi:chemotaxis signal transduction protein
VTAGGVLGARAGDLRTRFDDSFARVPEARADTVELLAIATGGNRYAVPVDDIAGLFAGQAVTALPGAPRGLLGVAGFRRTVVAVYDLGAVLGGTGGPDPRWMVLSATDPPVALAFDHFAGHARVPRGDLPLDGPAQAGALQSPAQAGALQSPAPDGALVGAVVRLAAGAHPVIRVPAVVDAIAARLRVARNSEEALT